MRSLLASLAVAALLADTLPAAAQSEPKGEPQSIVLGQVGPSFQGVAVGTVRERLEREGDIIEGLSPRDAARRGMVEDGEVVVGRSGKQS